MGQARKVLAETGSSHRMWISRRWTLAEVLRRAVRWTRLGREQQHAPDESPATVDTLQGDDVLVGADALIEDLLVSKDINSVISHRRNE